MPNSNFKIGLSLFGCAEKYTEQSTQCALVGLALKMDGAAWWIHCWSEGI